MLVGSEHSASTPVTDEYALQEQQRQVLRHGVGYLDLALLNTLHKAMKGNLLSHGWA